MGYTAQGRRKRDRIASISLDGFLPELRAIMNELPSTIINRVQSTGAGANEKGGAPKVFSPYNREYARKKGKTGRKDFTDTGSLWESFKVVDEDISGSSASFTFNVTGQNDDSRRSNEFLADVHSDKESTNILFPNGREMQELEEKLQVAINKYLTNVFR